MHARNSIGRRVSLLNDEYSNSKSADARSSSLSSLPSISSFYSGSPLAASKRKVLDSRSQSYAKSSANQSPRNLPVIQQHHYESASSSPSSTAKSDCSPTLSNCSTEVEALTANVQYSPEYYHEKNRDNQNRLTAARTLPIHTISAHQKQQQQQNQSNNRQEEDQNTTINNTTTSTIGQAQHHHHHHHHYHHLQRPAGPNPLLRIPRGDESDAALSRSSSTSNNSTSCSSNFSGTTSSLSSSASSLLLLSSSSSTSCSTSLSSPPPRTTTSATSSSSYIHNNNNNNNTTTDTKRPSLSSYHSIDSNSSTSTRTPLTPPTPSSLHNISTRSIPTLSTSIKKMMDPHSSKNMYPTMLASPTNDNFMYNHQMMNTASMTPRNSISGQYFSVPQQPLPPAISSTSPIMYSTMDSPNSLLMMDQYLPMSQSQQSPISAIPFSPYPTELLPSAMSLQQPTPNQSIAATSPSDTSNNSSAAAPKIAKKKYPCPHAVKYNCSDTFTTSGHAARHGKKHTGEKNIHCPVCNKAFTRKDNMKQHERTHRNKGEASKVAEAVESNRRTAAQHRSALSKSSTNSSNEIDMEDISPPPKRLSDPQASIRAANEQRRPNLSSVQQVIPPSLTSPTAADIPMPVSLDSGETLQQVAPSLHVDTLDKSFNNIFDHSFTSRSQETLLGRPPIFERTTSTGSGYSDGGGESPGLDALAMAAELS